MGYCENCKFWVGYLKKYPTKDPYENDLIKIKGGFCTSQKIHEDFGNPRQEDELVYSYIENGDFWTGPRFGCVNFRNK